MAEIQQPANVPLSNTPDDEDELSGDEKILALARKRFKQAEEQLIDIQREALDDLTFISGDQWPEAIKKQRTEPGGERPCLRINRLPTFINQVVNDGKQNSIQIKIRPTNNATEDIAEVKNGLIRHIQYNSESRRAIYDAFDYAVKCSIGAFRVTTDYSSDNSFHQDIHIKRIDNPLTVFVPINFCEEPDMSDMPWAFITDMMPKEEFKEEYPDEDLDNWASTAQSDVETRWLSADSVRVAEYFIKEETTKKIYLLSDGRTVDSKKNLPDGITVVKERETEDVKILWYKMTGHSILERKVFPGRHIPILIVTGPTVNLAGRKMIFSLTRWAKDPARMLNYYKSAQTEAIALAPLAPFLVAEGQIKGYEGQWKVANKKNLAFLPYKPQSNNGTPVPPPGRITPTGVDTALVSAIAETIDDMKAVTGIYDASLGAQGNEKSGKAIMARQREGDTSNYHFFDNLSYAIKHMGEIILEILPIIYDVPREIRILGQDETAKIVKINQAYQNEKGENKYYDFTTGEYDVVVDTGASYQTQRMEAAQTLIQLIQANPQLAPVTGDLLAKFIDAPPEIVERLKKLVPPQLQDQPNGPNQQGDPKDKMMIQQLDAVIQRMSQELQMLQSAVKDKQADRQVKMDSVVIKSNAEIQKAKLEHAHDFAMAQHGNAHELGMHMAQASTTDLQSIIDTLNNVSGRLDALEGQGQAPAGQSAAVPNQGA